MFVLEVVEVGVVVEVDAVDESIPSTPCRISFFVCVFCCAVEYPRGVSSIEETHEDTFGGGWQILKLSGSCEEKFSRMNEVSSTSLKACKRDKASAVPLLFPGMCRGWIEKDDNIHFSASVMAIS